jgi:hypothetical protein
MFFACRSKMFIALCFLSIGHLPEKLESRYQLPDHCVLLWVCGHCLKSSAIPFSLPRLQFFDVTHWFVADIAG